MRRRRVEEKEVDRESEWRRWTEKVTLFRRGLGQSVCTCRIRLRTGQGRTGQEAKSEAKA